MKRIRGFNPTRKQAKIMQKNKINPNEYLVKRVLSDRIECIHRFNGEIKEAFLDKVSV